MSEFVEVEASEAEVETNLPALDPAQIAKWLAVRTAVNKAQLQLTEVLLILEKEIEGTGLRVGYITFLQESTAPVSLREFGYSNTAFFAANKEAQAVMDGRVGRVVVQLEKTPMEVAGC